MNRKLILITILVLAALSACYVAVRKPAPAPTGRTLGSVDSDSGGYQATTTPYAGQIGSASGVVLLKGTSTAGTNASGILGSVIITGGPKSGTISLYDATTSNVNLRTGSLATSSITLIDIPAGVASTTYVLDVTFTRGLLLVTTGSVSTSTITWK